MRPGVPGWSETIHVRSLVGRFLEHSRVYYFENNGAPKVFIGSADAMERNFDRRVEVIAPVHSTELIHHLRHVVLASYLKDNVNARRLRQDGRWVMCEPQEGEERFDVQAWFLEQYQTMMVVGPRVEM